MNTSYKHGHTQRENLSACNLSQKSHLASSVVLCHQGVGESEVENWVLERVRQTERRWNVVWSWIIQFLKSNIQKLKQNYMLFIDQAKYLNRDNTDNKILIIILIIIKSEKGHIEENIQKL